jgi:hypothetical protein
LKENTYSSNIKLIQRLNLKMDVDIELEKIDLNESLFFNIM